MASKKSAFDQAFEYTIGNEGGYTNDPVDRGGPTNWGITQSELAKWRNAPVSPDDVKNLTKAEAESIYKLWYWHALGCEGVTSPGVAMALFDIGVVRGIGVPPKYAQMICNNHGAVLLVDGHLGPKSFSAINSMNPSVFIRDFSSMVEAGFRSIVARNPSQNRFLHGWINRAHRLLTLVGVA